ncbi:MAG: hypothetical protein RLZZ306_994 [Bacteroidota bacterium]|jgi:hypothetical protein
MKKQLLTVFLLTIVSVSFAQKVDLDRFYFDVKYQDLPSENVPLEKRTYGVHVKTGGPVINYISDAALYDKINLVGWKKVETADPTVGVDFTLEDFVFRGSEQKSETRDRKNSDGKVIGTDTYYWIEARYATRGFAKISGPITAKKEEPKKEEAKPVNKFLVNAVINKPVAPTEDAQSMSFSREIVYTSDKKTSNTVASEFNINKDAIYSQKLREFVDGAINSVFNRINGRYGFPEISTSELVWILDAKNDEGKTQTEAIEAVKEIFKGMKANESTEQLAANLQPLIDYFESLKTKYASDDKPGRKMRYSAYYNLAKIYLYLDQPDKAIKEGEAIVTNDYDPKDGKKLIEEANKLKDLFAKTGFTNRHNVGLK